MKKKYKPLWLIHNRAYRRYAKGLWWTSLRRYLSKAKRILLRKKDI